MRVVPVVLGVLALAVPLGGCGDDEEDLGIEPIPAAGEYAQTDPDEGTPGVPIGASYDVTGSEWVKLARSARAEAALEYVVDHPDECTTAKGTAAAEPVLDLADTSVGADYPLNAPIAELLAEGCAAALQSGESGLANPAP